MVHKLVNIIQGFKSQSLCNMHFYGLRGRQTQGPPRAAHTLATPLPPNLTGWIHPWLAVHSCPLLACRGRLRNSGANCSTIDLCCVTITWQQVFEDALQVTVVGVLPHVTMECRRLGR